MYVQCIVPNCGNEGRHAIEVIVRNHGSDRPSTGVVLRKITKARLCVDHAFGGIDFDISVWPTTSQKVRTTLRAIDPLTGEEGQELKNEGNIKHKDSRAYES